MGKKLSEEHKKNIKKGMMKYWDEHRGLQIQKNGYAIISIGNKKYYYHRYLMEKYIGRSLNKTEQVHHINGNKLDNRIENLILMPTSVHQRQHALKNKLGRNNIGKEPINKTSKNIIKQIKELREQGYLIREICDITNLSYPTILKYVKEN